MANRARRASAHAHDQGVEAHGARLQDQVGVAEAVVIGTPEIAGGIGRSAPEEPGLAPFEGGNDEDRGVDYALLVAADELEHSFALFRADGDVILAGLLVRPGRGVLRGGEQFPDFGLRDGLSGLVGADAPPGGEDFVQGGGRGRGLVPGAAGQQEHSEGGSEESFHGVLF